MSYDLYFFKKKENNISTNEIAEYLSTHLGANREEQQQWYFENEDTEVYFSIELNENDSDSEDEDVSDTMEDFDNSHFSFNLNFMRPGFFGLEAFKFVEQFCADLDLYVDNPQSSTELPYKPDQKEQFDIWNKTNQWATKDLDSDMGFLYMDETITNRV